MIHIPRQLAEDLQAWRLECEEKAREAFSKGKRKSASLSPGASIFENEDGGFLDTDNFRKRVRHEVARELQLPKLTFQVIRRTIATLAQMKGTIEDVQGVMRHSRTATTTGVTCRRSRQACNRPSIPSFGAEKIRCAEPEQIERVGSSRNSCQQSAQAFRTRDTK